VDLHVTAPNHLRVADFTCVANWSGFLHADFIIDAYAKTFVGWRVATKITADRTKDALEQVSWVHPTNAGLIHHSDHVSLHLSHCYTLRLVLAGIDAFAGTVGDAYGNALAETINGLFKTEVIWRRGPWKGREGVEYATLE
jgi:transposase InsO family protein